MIDLSRRNLLITAISAAAATTIPVRLARSQVPLDLGALKALVNSPRERTLLVLRMALTIDVLMHFIFTKAGLQDFEHLSKFLESPNWRFELDVFNSWLTVFSQGLYSERLNRAIGAENANSLIRSAADNAKILVEKAKPVFADESFSLNERSANQLLQAMYAVEQIEALRSGSKKPFLCRYFPFSYFCN